MTPFDRSDFETRLSEALNREAQSTAAMTDTLQELERFFRRTKRRQMRLRVIAAVAAVLIVIGGAVAAVALIGAGSPGHRHTTPSHHHKSTKSTGVPTSAFGPAKRLAGSVPVSQLEGPTYLGVAAFGDMWATAAGHPAQLYRLSSDGKHVLSQSGFPGVSLNQAAPVQLGQTIVVANGIGSDYIVFNKTGQKIGTLPNHSAGAMAGNSSGGWIATKPNQVAHIDATGLHIVRTFTLPLSAINGLAVSPGLLWVIDGTNNRLLRVDASTGTVTGQVNLPAAPSQVVYADGAVYVASQDFALRRIDPATMSITAAILSTRNHTVAAIASAPNGQLWAEGDEGTVAQLNPVTLRTERNIRVYNSQNAGVYGAVVTANRVFVSNGELYSFPAS
jgi:outer membrane protein assembly factor BamB